MFSLRSTPRIAFLATMVAVAWIAFGGVVLAAEMTDTEAAAASMKGPVWAVAYIVVLLLSALGVFVTIRSSKRRDRDKPEKFSATS